MKTVAAFFVVLIGTICCNAFAEDDKSEVAKSQHFPKDIPRPGLRRRYGGHYGGRYGGGPRIISGLEFIPGERDLRGYGRKSKNLGKYFPTGQVTYIRWGKTACPTGKGTQMIYKGAAAGSHYSHKGGGSDLLCLPEHPQFLSSRNGGNRAYLYQTEYETNTGPSYQGLHDHDVPCVTCLSTKRGTQIMIPGKTTCLKGWTREYYGYLMTANHNHPGRIQHVCVDINAEGVPGTSKNSNGALLYHVEVKRGTLPSAYVNGNEMACVVCTK